MRKLGLFFIGCSLVAVIGCGPSPVSLSTNANDIFWLTSGGADMPVWVKGNTASKVMILIVHGGPGGYSLAYDNPETQALQDRYGVAFWDQRDAGGSAGNDNFDELSLDRMELDLEDVVDVLKYRYGGDIELFLYAHSFGGLLAADYLTKGTNQTNLKGWVDIDGAHDYPLCNILSPRMLLDTGLAEIAKGLYVKQWTEIADYCRANPPNVSLAISEQTEDYAEAAEAYVPINHNTYPFDLFSSASPLSIGANALDMYYTTQGLAFQQTLETKNFTGGLSRVTIPSLLIWGRYDFTVPLGVGVEAFDSLGTQPQQKSLVVFDQSGHEPMVCQTGAVNDTIIGFVEEYR